MSSAHKGTVPKRRIVRDHSAMYQYTHLDL